MAIVLDVARSGSKMQNSFFKTGHPRKSILKPIFLRLFILRDLHCQVLAAYES